MLLKRASAYVHIADNQFDTIGSGNIPEVLLNGIDRKTVSDGKNLKGFVGGWGGFGCLGREGRQT